MIRLLFALLPSLALAEGFAVDDLKQVEAEALAALGPGWEGGATAPGRLTLYRVADGTMLMADVLLGRQTDGTEGRVRRGETSMADLEALCQARDPSCRLEGLSVGPAIGWTTRYSGRVTGATTVLFRDGDMLTVRAVAPEPGPAAEIAGTLARAVGPAIVGE